MDFFERHRAAGVPNAIVSKRQKRPRENRAGGSKGGDGRKCANLAGLRECRMKAGIPFPATLCRPPRDAVRTDAAPASAGRGGRLAKRQSDFARGQPPNRKKKPPEAPFFPPFHTSGNFLAARNSRLCGKKGISFSKEIPFLPHENARRGGEMRHTDSSPARFLTIRDLFPTYQPATWMPHQAENLPF